MLDAHQVKNLFVESNLLFLIRGETAFIIGLIIYGLSHL